VVSVEIVDPDWVRQKQDLKLPITPCCNIENLTIFPPYGVMLSLNENPWPCSKCPAIDNLAAVRFHMLLHIVKALPGQTPWHRCGFQ
jgi:hypothetical protein